MAIYADLAIDAGARIIGGCCGTKPSHLAAMRRALDAHRPGERPDLARIVAALGPLASPPAAEPPPRSRRRDREGA
jgi:5-methyltetrahydrofolate--homocysteine methyltransferase